MEKIFPGKYCIKLRARILYNIFLLKILGKFRIFFHVPKFQKFSNFFRFTNFLDFLLGPRARILKMQKFFIFQKILARAQKFLRANLPWKKAIFSKLLNFEPFFSDFWETDKLKISKMKNLWWDYVKSHFLKNLARARQIYDNLKISKIEFFR